MPHLGRQSADLDQVHVDRLARVAVEFVARIRGDYPESDARWLRAALPDRADQRRPLLLLASEVPENRLWTHLTAGDRHHCTARDSRLHPLASAPEIRPRLNSVRHSQSGVRR